MAVRAQTPRWLLSATAAATVALIGISPVYPAGPFFLTPAVLLAYWVNHRIVATRPASRFYPRAGLLGLLGLPLAAFALLTVIDIQRLTEDGWLMPALYFFANIATGAVLLVLLGLVDLGRWAMSRQQRA
ncbi:hypothetical protein [Kineosporia babensis]|uniref:Uncharacterized protein n=1 Tax=Kineosporia babensis TaxID=499548 RepID=A0A9X1NI90_9ACTN|nr:hypothetical protein [Kineosporia babensis]MCD5313593.1 hypothetical protein [Kineosporia babensis]